MSEKITSLYAHYLKFPKISTDTRKIEPGSIFFALKGESFNGNTFASRALEAGASLAVVDEKEYASDSRCFLVDDVLVALQELANHHRRQLNIPVVGITGSNGKTTSKELIRAVLSKKFKTLATIGNLNNHIGVPLTLLSITKDVEIAVVEMGANHQKEIALLCSIAQPTHGIITNVGKAHLEGFGGFEGIKKGKGEMIEYLKANNGVLFVNNDSSDLLSMASGMDRKITYGTKSGSDITGSILSETPFVTLSWSTKGSNSKLTASSHLSGHYNFENMLAAVAIGNHFGVSPENISGAISEYVPSNMRSQRIEKGSNLIHLDAYNANPSSMTVSIQSFFKNATTKQKVVILGDMMELGSESSAEHKSILMLLSKYNTSHVLLIGTFFAEHASLLTCKTFPTTAEAGVWLNSNNFDNTEFLIKGSRKMTLEKLVECIC